MDYNKEMFSQTLKAAELTSVSFDNSVTWDDGILECGEKYLNRLFNEGAIVLHCEGDPDRYYYMIATHAMYAGFCIANGEKKGNSRDDTLKAVLSYDAVAIFSMTYREVDTDKVDFFASDVYDFAIYDFQNKYGQEYIIDNNNEYMVGLLLAFFVIGYNLKPEYFDEQEDYDAEDDDIIEESEMLDPNEFSAKCAEEFQSEVRDAGYLTKVVLIPELLPIGQKIALAFLQDNYFQMEFGNNPAQYYYVINSLCLQAGCVVADMWHQDFDRLKNGFVDTIIKEGPAKYAKPIFRKEFDLDSDGDAGTKLYSKVFNKWKELHEPYWNLDDPRDYTFGAMVASFQTGVSMVLSKYGY